MKNSLLFLLIFALFAGACNNDDDVGEEIVFSNPETVINYDAVNFSAPQIPAGEYEMAVKFPASQMQAFTGKRLKDVAVYLASVPAATEFFVYGQGSDNVQGDILYTADVSSSVGVDRWNSHRLSTPIILTGEDLWVSVYVDHPETFGSVGCDEGPATTNGDLMFEYGTTDWQTLRTFTSGASSINWNIRANIGD